MGHPARPPVKLPSKGGPLERLKWVADLELEVEAEQLRHARFPHRIGGIDERTEVHGAIVEREGHDGSPRDLCLDPESGGDVGTEGLYGPSITIHREPRRRPDEGRQHLANEEVVARL